MFQILPTDYDELHRWRCRSFNQMRAVCCKKFNKLPEGQASNPLAVDIDVTVAVKTETQTTSVARYRCWSFSASGKLFAISCLSCCLVLRLPQDFFKQKKKKILLRVFQPLLSRANRSSNNEPFQFFLKTISLKILLRVKVCTPEILWLKHEAGSRPTYSSRLKLGKLFLKKKNKQEKINPLKLAGKTLLAICECATKIRFQTNFDTHKHRGAHAGACTHTRTRQGTWKPSNDYLQQL